MSTDSICAVFQKQQWIITLFDCNNYCNDQLSTCQQFWQSVQFPTTTSKTAHRFSHKNTYSLPALRKERKKKKKKKKKLCCSHVTSVWSTGPSTRLGCKNKVLHLSFLIHMSKYTPGPERNETHESWEKHKLLTLPFITAAPQRSSLPPFHLSPWCQGRGLPYAQSQPAGLHGSRRTNQQ